MRTGLFKVAFSNQFSLLSSGHMQTGDSFLTGIQFERLRDQNKPITTEAINDIPIKRTGNVWHSSRIFVADDGDIYLDKRAMVLGTQRVVLDNPGLYTGQERHAASLQAGKDITYSNGTKVSPGLGSIPLMSKRGETINNDPFAEPSTTGLCIYFTATGDLNAIRDMLVEAGYIGPGYAKGFGAIASVTYQEIEETELPGIIINTHEGRILTRPVPVENDMICGVSLNGIRHFKRTTRYTNPYRDSENVLCADRLKQYDFMPTYDILALFGVE